MFSPEPGNDFARATSRGLFVTGAPRSGTTWVGRMLALGQHFYYLHEPFNNRLRRQYPGIYGRPFACFYPYLSPPDQGAPGMQAFMDWATGAPEPAGWGEADQGQWSEAQKGHLLELRQSRREGRVPLIKDPVGVLALEWVIARYQLPVMAMVRHPAEFVRSLMQLDWHVGPGFFVRQEAFMATLPGDVAAEVVALHGSTDRLRKTALMWKVMNCHIMRVASESGDQMHLLRHEDLAADPRAGFAALLAAMGLDDEPHLDAIEQWSGPHNPVQPEAIEIIKRDSRGNFDRWRSWFGARDMAVIREMTEPLACQLGYTFDSPALS